MCILCAEVGVEGAEAEAEFADVAEEELEDDERGSIEATTDKRRVDTSNRQVLFSFVVFFSFVVCSTKTQYLQNETNKEILRCFCCACC